MVVVEGDGEVVQEREDARGMVAETVEEIEGFGPDLLVPLMEEDEFAQQVGVAEGVLAVVFEIGFPEVVDGTDLEGAAAAPGLEERACLWCRRVRTRAGTLHELPPHSKSISSKSPKAIGYWYNT